MGYKLMRNQFLNRNFLQRLRIASIVALLFQAFVPFMTGTAMAAPEFNEITVRLDRVAASNGGSVFASGTVCANMSAANVAGTETTARVVFPTGFVLSATQADWAVNSTTNTSWPAGSVAWTGIAQPTNAPAAQTVDFVSGNLASAAVYCFNWTNSTTALRTPATSGNNLAGTVTTRTGAYPGTADAATSAYAVSIIGSSITADQVNVTATVPPTFIFTLSGNSQAFSTNLDPSSTVSTAALNISVTTNANGGWVAYVKDLSANAKTVSDTSSGNLHGALMSPTAANYKISNNTTNSIGTAAHTNTAGAEDYGFAVTSVTAGGGGQAGTPSANAAYDSTGGFATCSGNGTCKMGPINPSFYSPFASSTGTSAGDVINFVERATVSGVTPAATDYADTLTIVAAGRF